MKVGAARQLGVRAGSTCPILASASCATSPRETLGSGADSAAAIGGGGGHRPHSLIEMGSVGRSASSAGTLPAASSTASPATWVGSNAGVAGERGPKRLLSRGWPTSWGSPRHGLALGEASGASWPRSEPPVVFHTGELPDPADQFHAAGGGSQHTGVDDGFVIKASATTGKAEWIKHYPESNRDAQVVGVDVDASGNVFGSGYSCFSMWSKRCLRGAPQLATPIP